ncbi:MAG: CorA metal ion transporter [Cirrosporium novae-zelandiae]|nr:MAG: CorA metal ion transporter [Cirrosporium novae-zelandiae]
MSSAGQNAPPGKLTQGSRGNRQTVTGPQSDNPPPTGSTGAKSHVENPASRKRSRRRRRQRNKRLQSFAAPIEEDTNEEGNQAIGASRELPNIPQNGSASGTFYRLGPSARMSATSLESEALLDHREQQPMRLRRDSQSRPSIFGARPRSHDVGTQFTDPFTSNDSLQRRPRTMGAQQAEEPSSDEECEPTNDRTPLLSKSFTERADSTGRTSFGLFGVPRRDTGTGSRQRRPSITNSTSSLRPKSVSTSREQDAYDINNPPSRPGSPRLGIKMSYDDALVTNDIPASPQDMRSLRGDVLINIGEDRPDSRSSTTPPKEALDHRRHTIAVSAEEDVCFPQEDMSMIGEEESRYQNGSTAAPRKRQRRGWPDLSFLEEWSHEEKESRSDLIKPKTVNEPITIGGRLRPSKTEWHRVEEDAPYRFTYFNENFDSTIHAQNLCELLQEGQTFQDLFLPEPPLLTDDSSDEEEDSGHQGAGVPLDHHMFSPVPSKNGTRQSSSVGATRSESLKTDSKSELRNGSGTATPSNDQPSNEQKQRYGDRPMFWLDVLSPTDAEMRVLAKTFGIHPLTAEDVMVEEAREKVELFRNYYFINYRSFEQDESSEDYMEPVNFYIIVFRDGILTFHFSQSPHPNNVRRRIRQLKDYLVLNSDWVCFAIIDDITDSFGPKIHGLEEEVDEIDDVILEMHAEPKEPNLHGYKDNPKGRKCAADEKRSEYGDDSHDGVDMLRRVGAARKKVMKFFRLLGNKADVIKGFAKRCNKQWEMAPRSDIGLYLGDIQDHVLTMTSNLSHFETLLGRSHSNYLAQISIKMNERQEATADGLNKLTVLGTIVLPMNVVTGLWGMNCLVPGQDIENLNWFFALTGALILFGLTCYLVAKKVFKLM